MTPSTLRHRWMPIAAPPPWLSRAIHDSVTSLAVAIALLVPAGALAQANQPTITYDTVSSQVLQSVATNLPESRAVGAAFLSPTYDPNLVLTQAGSARTTFLSEGAGYRNSLGWFTYQENTFSGLTKSIIDTNGDGVVAMPELNAVSGVSSGYLFANASAAGSGGSLNAGATVDVAGGQILSAGTRLGFFLVQDGFDGTGARGGGLGTGQRQIFYSLDFLNPEAAASGTLANAGSAEARHVAMMFADESRQQVILGFEDLNRATSAANVNGYGSDEDFNDAVFTISATPATVFENSNIYTAPAPPLEAAAVAILAVAAYVGRRQRVTA